LAIFNASLTPLARFRSSLALAYAILLASSASFARFMAEKSLTPADDLLQQVIRTALLLLMMLLLPLLFLILATAALFALAFPSIFVVICCIGIVILIICCRCSCWTRGFDGLLMEATSS
jgi:hypothetical protein